jgi:hypothetical protein
MYRYGLAFGLAINGDLRGVQALYSKRSHLIAPATSPASLPGKTKPLLNDPVGCAQQPLLEQFMLVGRP